jgi:hypothetical protein
MAQYPAQVRVRVEPSVIGSEQSDADAGAFDSADEIRERCYGVGHISTHMGRIPATSKFPDGGVRMAVILTT